MVRLGVLLGVGTGMLSTLTPEVVVSLFSVTELEIKVTNPTLCIVVLTVIIFLLLNPTSES